MSKILLDESGKILISADGKVYKSAVIDSTIIFEEPKDSAFEIVVPISKSYYHGDSINATKEDTI